MAIETGNLDMVSGQLECGCIMVESGWRPSFQTMAGSTIRPQLAFMGIILGVTGIAVLRGRFQLRNGAGPGVALGTGHPGMFPGQLKNCQAVVESVAISVHPIMTAQAFIPISL